MMLVLCYYIFYKTLVYSDDKSDVTAVNYLFYLSEYFSMFLHARYTENTVKVIIGIKRVV